MIGGFRILEGPVSNRNCQIAERKNETVGGPRMPTSGPFRYAHWLESAGRNSFAADLISNSGLQAPTPGLCRACHEAMHAGVAEIKLAGDRSHAKAFMRQGANFGRSLGDGLPIALPLRVPCFLAWFMPERTRSMMSCRSNCANTESMPASAWPAAVVRSMLSATLTKATLSSTSSCMLVTKSAKDRPLGRA